VRVCKDRNSIVHIVVNLDTVLAWVGAENSTDILDDLAFRLHREHKEYRVECRTVEALADVRPRGYGKEGSIALP